MGVDPFRLHCFGDDAHSVRPDQVWTYIASAIEACARSVEIAGWKEVDVRRLGVDIDGRHCIIETAPNRSTIISSSRLQTN